MRISSIAAVAAIAVMTLTMTACDPGSSMPAVTGAHRPAPTRVVWPAPTVEPSAALACQDFGVWYASIGGPAFASTLNLGTLTRAKAEAPAGGRLHHDLSALLSDVIAAARGGRLLMQTAAYAVERDCQLVNSSSVSL